MKHIVLQDNAPRRLSFYLAMEEYVARRMPHIEDAFFMWQVEASVIFGRNQVMENEVNTTYCREHDIQMYRRKSGGGCVYADMGNVMLSFITSNDSVTLTYNRYVNMVLLVLHKMGIEAKASGRNDILIGDRKVSGNAFYQLPGRSIVHGTFTRKAGETRSQQRKTTYHTTQRTHHEDPRGSKKTLCYHVVPGRVCAQ